ncbi:hypothetical protein [Streptococcus sp. X13SY08]|uniref:hypothetical protein n=1 Tax=Streptococcus sp. X13SY08 TaxID=1676616 RepID=UPI00069FE394|nr:hypothetical protein [Streptococcus sp. X13SY08]
MGKEQEKRLIELYEKGILTKEEARACFLELAEEGDFTFVEERSKLNFTLPSFKVFSSSKRKQEYSFDTIEAMTIRLTEGRIHFIKNKKDQIHLSILYPHEADLAKLAQIFIEEEKLLFETGLPCQLTFALPEKWMSVLDLDLGCADARLDFLPFEDISIHSQTSKKQQDVRLTSTGSFSQFMTIQLAHAHVQVQVPKKQGIKGRVEGEIIFYIFK